LVAAGAKAGTDGEIGSHEAREDLERFGEGLRQAGAGSTLPLAGHVAIVPATPAKPLWSRFRQRCLRTGNTPASASAAPATSEVASEISLAKNRLLGRDTYEQTAGRQAAPLIAAVWRETEAELRRSNAVDFDDLLVCAVRVLAEHAHYRESQDARWSAALIVGAEQHEDGVTRARDPAAMPNWANRRGTSPKRNIM
jgi:UvrD-like helicase family protein